MRPSPIALLGLVAASALAQSDPDPEAVVMRAEAVHEQHCADLGQARSDSAAAAGQGAVTDAWQSVIAAYDDTGASYLVYWRGVLSECLENEERAARDYLLFVQVEEQKERSSYSALVRDAKTRLRRLRNTEPELTEGELATALERASSEQALGLKAARLPARRPPAVLVQVGGVYQNTGGFHGGGAVLGASLRLKDFFRMDLRARGVVNASQTHEGEARPVQRHLLLGFAVGPSFQFAGPVHPRFGVAFQAAPNPAKVAGSVVLVGVEGHAAVDLPLGGALLLRPWVEVGNLERNFVLRGGASLVFGLGR